MREIEFRGQEIDNSEWVYGLLTFIGEKYSTIHVVYPKHEMDYRVKTETVSQYIGRRDRNDKKIYEYNVIELFYSVSDRHQGIIEWDMRGFWRINWNKKASVYNFRLDIFSGDNFKIIGNKFENPELLEMENG